MNASGPSGPLVSFCMMFGTHFDNVSVFLNSVVAGYIHLATSSVKITY